MTKAEIIKELKRLVIKNGNSYLLTTTLALKNTPSFNIAVEIYLTVREETGEIVYRDSRMTSYQSSKKLTGFNKDRLEKTLGLVQLFLGVI